MRWNEIHAQQRFQIGHNAAKGLKYLPEPKPFVVAFARFVIERMVQMGAAAFMSSGAAPRRSQYAKRAPSRLRDMLPRGANLCPRGTNSANFA